MFSFLLASRSLVLPYPTRNRYGVPLEFVERDLDVKQIYDFSLGLPVRFLIREPRIRRGRHLIMGIDRHCLAVRKFWYEASHGRDLPEYRLGLSDRDYPGELVDWVGRIFGPTENEQLRMRRLAIRWQKILKERGETRLRLAAYPGIW